MPRFLAATMGVALIGIASVATAADEPAAAVKYRQAVMKAIGGHTGSIAAVAKGQVSYGSHVVEHARSLAAMGRIAADLFPAGSGQSSGAKTGALASIWDKPDDFKKAVDAFQTATADFAKAAESGDMQATMAAFGAVGKSCGGCHKPFREKQ